MDKKARSGIDDRTDWQQEFVRKIASPNRLLDLFDTLPGIYLFIKNHEGQYVRINQEMATMFGLEDPIEIVGKTDFDMFPPAIAASYVEQDHSIITSMKPMLDKRGFMPGPDGLPRWFVYSKYPLLDDDDNVVGVAGVKHSCEALGDDGSSRFGRLLTVVQYVTNRYGSPIGVADLAAHADLSVSQLQREFSRLLGITPAKYIQEVRIGVAQHMLKTTDVDLASIADACGFYDQSHFSRQFKSLTGLAPMKYRQRYLSNQVSRP